jgi:glycosyltransferase involved in cell wall biosynthesis
MNSLNQKKNKIKLLFVGSVLPDNKKYYTKAFSKAGSMFQENLLDSLKSCGLNPSKIISFQHIQSFPSSDKIFIKKNYVYIKNKMRVTLLPFLNITPIKQICLGLSCFFTILFWGIQNRNSHFLLIYTYNLSVPPGLVTLLAAKLIGAKCVVSLNDVHIPGETVPNNFLNRFDFWMHKKIIPYFDGHVVVADSIMKDFAPNLPYIRLEGGVSTSMLQKTKKSKLNKVSGTKNFVIVSVGSLTCINGFNLLLKAFSLLKSSKYRLVIAGAGPLEEKIKESAKKDSRINFRGVLKFNEVLELYNSADLLINLRITKKINTKYFFPSKLIEYLMSGKPVLTSYTGHAFEEFGDFAYFLKNENPSNIASMIQYISLLDPKVREVNGILARKYICKFKTWEKQGRILNNYFHKIFHAN